MFRQFIQNFRKTFELAKNKEYLHSYFKWTDPLYQKFMIALMRYLEPRRVPEKELIIHELQDVLEVIFVMKGSFTVGYEINKVKKMKLHFPPGTQFGAFNCLFRKKSLFLYQSWFFIEGYCIRKHKLEELGEKFPSLMTEFKKKIILSYENDVR